MPLCVCVCVCVCVYNRKGNVCRMLRLGLLYVCGREFESSLMTHDKVTLSEGIYVCLCVRHACVLRGCV